jgi:hypothetical protein
MPQMQAGVSVKTVTMPQTAGLPRLLYVGDVPVESSYHGSALLYRLLQDYPTDRLRVVETQAFRSLPARRLHNVEYGEFSIGNTRLLKTRFSRWAVSALAFQAPGRLQALRSALDGFVPEAVLTVAHGYSWFTAAKLASADQIPLHLIVHDDYPTMTPVLPWLKQWQDNQFARVYRQSASRLCVSPFMEEEYRQRYGVAGSVLYPSRAKQSPASGEMPETYARGAGPLVGAFAGNIVEREYAVLIAALAERLEQRSGKLLLFGPHSTESLSAFGLNRRNIVPQGMIDSDQLIRRLRVEADFVFAPMAFDAVATKDNMRLSFPSKLTDYTATGLPILICGPAHCSAARWARDHSPVAELITSKQSQDFDGALDRLESPSHREWLGKAATATGNRLFSQQGAFDLFKRALLKSQSV